MNVTPDNITSLKENECFVYGANRAGRHGAGAAKAALRWGAVYGQYGVAGQTYGICTKDESLRTLTLPEIEVEVATFLSYAFYHPNIHFLVTPIGCGLAGLTPEQIAPMFRAAMGMKNVSLPEAFWRVLTNE